MTHLNIGQYDASKVMAQEQGASIKIIWRTARRPSEAAVNVFAFLPPCEAVIRFHTLLQHLRQTPRLLCSRLAKKGHPPCYREEPKDQK